MTTSPMSHLPRPPPCKRINNLFPRLLSTTRHRCSPPAGAPPPDLSILLTQQSFNDPGSLSSILYVQSLNLHVASHLFWGNFHLGLMQRPIPRLPPSSYVSICTCLHAPAARGSPPASRSTSCSFGHATIIIAISGLESRPWMLHRERRLQHLDRL